MKTYEETIRAVFAGRDAMIEKKSQRKRRLKRTLIPVACGFAVLLAGAGLWRSGILHKKTPVLPAEPEAQSTLPAVSPEETTALPENAETPSSGAAATTEVPASQGNTTEIPSEGVTDAAPTTVPAVPPAETETPEGVDAMPFALCCWIFDRIRDANGLGIFAHPNWISNVLQIPEKLTDYMMEKQPFDAFEVLGGENYYEQNGFQTARYYEERAKGRRFPIVGSTDSHSSYESNANAFICATIVFSPENERKALIASIKDFYSVAVDTISKEFRLVGEARFIRYGDFLLKNYFPLHDELCYEEGRLMKQYVTGTEEERAEALAGLNAITGRMKKQREKYFDF